MCVLSCCVYVCVPWWRVRACAAEYLDHDNTLINDPIRLLNMPLPDVDVTTTSPTSFLVPVYLLVVFSMQMVRLPLSCAALIPILPALTLLRCCYFTATCT